MNLKMTIYKWLHKLLLPIVKSFFNIKKTWDLHKIENKGVKLPYVLMENQSSITNNSFLPIRLIKIRLQMMNKEAKVNRILYDGFLKLPPKSNKQVVMEVRLNHISAFFNMIRFIFTTDVIPLRIVGEIQIKIFGFDFFIPVEDTLDMPKSKVQMVINNQIDKKTITDIPFEEVGEAPSEEIVFEEADSRNLISPNNPKLENSVSSDHNPL